MEYYGVRVEKFKERELFYYEKNCAYEKILIDCENETERSCLPHMSEFHDNKEYCFRDSYYLLKNFTFKGPLPEMKRFVQYVMEQTGEKTAIHIDRWEAVVDLKECRTRMFIDFPMLKACGFALRVKSQMICKACVLYKESGYFLPLRCKDIMEYDRDSTLTFKNGKKKILTNEDWPIQYWACQDFKVGYKRMSTKKNVSLDYLFPFAHDWNDEKYVFKGETSLGGEDTQPPYFYYTPPEYYEISEDVLIKYLGKERRVIIPDHVHTVGEKAFLNHDMITEVTAGTLEKIEKEAFKGCCSLKRVNLTGCMLTSIGEDAFAGCEKLTELIIPNSVVSIESGAFFESGLETVVWPSGMEEIPSAMFRDCNHLYKITIPPQVKRIGRRVFNRENVLVIIGKAGSYAEQYAKDNGYHFQEG